MFVDNRQFIGNRHREKRDIRDGTNIWKVLCDQDMHGKKQPGTIQRVSKEEAKTNSKKLLKIMEDKNRQK